jgi:hypothetical protein
MSDFDDFFLEEAPNSVSQLMANNLGLGLGLGLEIGLLNKESTTSRLTLVKVRNN